ncbi:DNA polymerase beta superfamily protein [Sphingobacterium multivorum]|uniref:nucleotidyltransferase domain-containing protein n=1 Tax=Sphingobacterium multivorum TaxID=28454 RepID=UPI002FDD6A14
MKKLMEIEASEGVRILFACESGSRGWRFPSIDSDYDVRFIYVRKAEDYSLLFPLPTEMRFPITDDLDIAGWDQFKVLTLMYKSNVSPFEWIQSPVVYHEFNGFKTSFRTMIENYFDARRHAHHYLGIVRSKVKDLRRETIKLKSLFYILRSLLAADWSMTYRSYAPMTLAELSVLLPNVVKVEVMQLQKLKSQVDEGFVFSCSATIRRLYPKRNYRYNVPIGKSFCASRMAPIAMRNFLSGRKSFFRKLKSSACTVYFW